MKLVPHLVPKALWGISAKRKLNKASWARIRAAVIADVGGHCAACGTVSEVPRCNEAWRYEAALSVACLDGLEILCPECHDATHAGRAKQQGRLDRVVKRIAGVNRISPEEAFQLIEAAFARWADLNQVALWKIEISQDLAARFPELNRLTDRS